MDRPKRTQFWGRHPDDDHLVHEIIAGEKTATVCKADEYELDMGEFDDGGLAVGDVVDVYDLRERLRCRIEITEIYPVRFGDVPEKLWKGEVCRSAEHFRQAHRRCWPDEDLTDDFEMIATHFRLVETLDPGPAARPETGSIRALTEDDREAFVELRRASLVAAPMAFGRSPEDDVVSTVDAARDLLARAPLSVVFGAFDPALVGMVGLHRERPLKAAHRATVWGMYVAPDHRGRGLGAGLLAAAIAHARTLDGVRWVQLSVSSTTPEARRLYERAGFQVWGDEPEALLYEGRTATEHHMALRLG